MLKSKTPVSESLSHSVTGVGIELSQTKVWTAENNVFPPKNLIHIILVTNVVKISTYVR